VLFFFKYVVHLINCTPTPFRKSSSPFWKIIW